MENRYHLFPFLVSGLGLDTATAMELAPLIRPETTKAADTRLTMPPPTTTTAAPQLPGSGKNNSDKIPGMQGQGQSQGVAAAASIPLQPQAPSSSPFSVPNFRAKAEREPGICSDSEKPFQGGSKTGLNGLSLNHAEACSICQLLYL